MALPGIPDASGLPEPPPISELSDDFQGMIDDIGDEMPSPPDAGDIAGMIINVVNGLLAQLNLPMIPAPPPLPSPPAPPAGLPSLPEMPTGMGAMSGFDLPW